MRKIKINTTQNVSIEYEVAQLWERIIAFVIDAFILWVSVWILGLISVGLGTVDYFFYLVIVPYFLFYTLAQEIFFNGQTLGKRVLDIRVAKLNGTEVTTSDYLLRWAFRSLDIYFSFGIIAALFVRSSHNGQRVGDFAAETTLIKLRPSRRISFDDVLRIQSVDNYEPIFPQVKRLPEEEIVLIKNVYERYKKYPNLAHREIVYVLIQKLKEKLDISEIKMSEADFLKTLIKDFVVLTRS
ncbi:MAG: RDD family protein [Bacteroidota bacterium]